MPKLILKGCTKCGGDLMDDWGELKCFQCDEPRDRPEPQKEEEIPHKKGDYNRRDNGK